MDTSQKAITIIGQSIGISRQILLAPSNGFIKLQASSNAWRSRVGRPTREPPTAPIFHRGRNEIFGIGEEVMSQLPTHRQ